MACMLLKPEVMQAIPRASYCFNATSTAPAFAPVGASSLCAVESDEPDGSDRKIRWLLRFPTAAAAYPEASARLAPAACSEDNCEAACPPTDGIHARNDV